MRIYIAGPMRGHVDLNFPTFRATAEYLRSLGHEVLNPVEIGEKHFGDDVSLHPSQYLMKDIMELLTCDTLCLLAGWQHSVGARCEVAIAITLGFKFIEQSGQEIDTPSVRIDQGYE